MIDSPRIGPWHALHLRNMSEYSDCAPGADDVNPDEGLCVCPRVSSDPVGSPAPACATPPLSRPAWDCCAPGDTWALGVSASTTPSMPEDSSTAAALRRSLAEYLPVRTDPRGVIVAWSGC